MKRPVSATRNMHSVAEQSAENTTPCIYEG